MRVGPPLDSFQHPAGLASVRITMRRRGLPTRCRTPSTNHRERTSNSDAVQYSAIVLHPEGVVPMLGEQPTSASDRIQGEWETREVYSVGGRLNPSESLAVARHPAHGFGWGDGGSCAAQLALASLLRKLPRCSRHTLDAVLAIRRTRTPPIVTPAASGPLMPCDIRAVWRSREYGRQPTRTCSVVS